MSKRRLLALLIVIASPLLVAGECDFSGSDDSDCRFLCFDGSDPDCDFLCF